MKGGITMSEEEKKAIETVESFIKYYKTNEQTGNRANLDVLREECQAIEFILNKYDVTQKELNSLKEIEKSHQEENGKLRVELEQEKERNELFVASGNNINLERHIKNNYISKDKIKEKIEELEKEQKEYKNSQEWEIQDDIVAQINILKDLLEEK